MLKNLLALLTCITALVAPATILVAVTILLAATRSRNLRNLPRAHRFTGLMVMVRVTVTLRTGTVMVRVMRRIEVGISQSSDLPDNSSNTTCLPVVGLAVIWSRVTSASVRSCNFQTNPSAGYPALGFFCVPFRLGKTLHLVADRNTCPTSSE